MYFGALIKLANGSKKAVEVEGKGPLGLVKFMSAIAEYAKKENKLLKVCCDDWKAIKFLESNLKNQGTKVDFGVPGSIQLELVANE